MRSYVDDARQSVVHLRRGTLVVPPVEASWPSRWRRFLFGFTLPFVLANRCFHHETLGPRAQRVLVVQALVSLALGVFWFFAVDAHKWEFDNGLAIRLGDEATGIAAFIGVLAITEWFVIAVSRELHDQIGADVSRLVGVLPDDDVENPRVRLNLRWMWTKLKRRLQGGLVMMVSLLPSVVIVGVGLTILLPFFGDVVQVLVNIAVALVLFYWLAVIALGKTSWAWRQEPDRDPLPLLALTSLGARSRWLFPFRAWAWCLRRAMKMLVRPARLLERCSVEGAGLAVARTIMGFPIVYVVARPFFPVASTVLLTARAPELFVPPPTETPTTEPSTTTTPTFEPVVTTE